MEDMAHEGAAESETEIQLRQILKKLFPQGIRRILLVQPPDVAAEQFNFAACRRGRISNPPPYGLGVLAAQVRKIGIDVRLVNLNNVVLRAALLQNIDDAAGFCSVWMKMLEESIASFQPDLAGVTSMFTMTHNSLVKVCEHIHQYAPQLAVAVGGVHITNSLAAPDTAERIFTDLPGANLFFTHESDMSFSDFINVVNGQMSVGTLSQMILRNADKLLRFEKRATPPSEYLDTIPAHDLIEPEELSKWGKVGAFYFFHSADIKVSTVLSNRGCRASCTFCSVRNFNGVGVRRRSVSSVIEELKILRFEHDVRHFMWLDDDLFYNTKMAIELFNAIYNENLGMTWDCSNGVIAASCTDDLIAPAVASGCIGLFIGMESGNREILRAIRKPGTPEIFLKAAATLRKYEQIHARIFLILGFPDETIGKILDTVEVARQMDLDWCQIQTLQPLPNTPIYRLKALEEGENEEFDNVKLTFGSYGKATNSRERRDIMSLDFKDALSHSDLNRVPEQSEIPYILANMIFNLNYKRLFNEHRAAKLVQQFKYLKHLSKVIAPSDALSLYFSAMLSHRLDGRVDSEIATRLTKIVEESPYWNECFDNLGISLDHLKFGTFPIRA